MASTTTKRRTARKKSTRKTSRAPKMIYSFGKTKTDGLGSQRELLGGKGANLADMTSIGLPVPPGFTITTKTCEAFNTGGGKLPSGLMASVKTAVARLERETGKKFGSKMNPLLVSVRSGAAVSMPGMMDTILNLGLTDEAVDGMAALTGNDRFALDAYRRLINMFGDVVMGVDHHHFEAEFDAIKKKYKMKTKKAVSSRFKRLGGACLLPFLRPDLPAPRPTCALASPLLVSSVSVHVWLAPPGLSVPIHNFPAPVFRVCALRAHCAS